MNRRLHLSDLLALAALTLAVLVTYARVLFTPLIPASGDFLSYFAPYWQMLNEALRAGRLPLWNNYIFAGAPFQANPQTEVFYPLRWPLIFLSAEKGILWTAALHAWLAGVFGYFLVRRLLQSAIRNPQSEIHDVSLPALAAALLIALNGWTTGLLLHPNQISAYPWLFAAILLWEKRPRPGRWPRWNRAGRRWGVLMTLIWTLVFLAGHTQSFYNAVVIFGLWVAGDIFWRKVMQGRQSASEQQKPAGRFAFSSLLADYWPVALLALLTAGAVAAVQLWPTLALSQLSYRQGGLAFRDHAAMSLPPWRLGFTLLPHYTRDLGQALGTDAYGEWIGYAGLAGLFLALMGLRHSNRRLRFLGVLLTVVGLLLAFGAYDPLEYGLYRLLPGWNLFRVPARFLQAVVLGVALLAALGMDRIIHEQRILRNGGGTGWIRTSARFHLQSLTLLLVLLLAALTRPNLPTLLGWTAVSLFFGLLLARPRSFTSYAPYFTILILFLELYFASYALPIQHPTAPQALRSWRTAPARIAAELGPLPHDAACRTLSLSATTYDPGDMEEMKRIFVHYLDEKAMLDLINSTKAKEVVAPNLGALFQIPSLDGFGGGVLPTARFIKAMTLFLPPERIVADGRLREQLDHVPDARLLNLFDVCTVITDKNFDVWHNGIYYDLAFGETLDAAHPELILADMPGFPASGIGIVSHLGPEAAKLPAGAPIAQVIVTFYDGSTFATSLGAGTETVVGPDVARPPTQNSLPAVRWPRNLPGQDAIAELDLPENLPLTLSNRRLKAVSFHLLREDVTLFIRGMAVYDRQSHAHATPVVSRWPWHRIHSGDVKIYRNDAMLPRAFTVARVQTVSNLDQAVAVMRAPDFDPAQTAVLVERDGVLAPHGITLTSAQPQIFDYRPERISLHYRAADNAFLVIADAWHPGWRAVLDPDAPNARPLDILPVDVFLRGIPLPAGEHDLQLDFHPRSLHRGLFISLLALAGLILLWFLPDAKH
ncbi:MAG: hypothetical protein DSY55_01760 [Clostridia bacterium]|nr:MAG: hypothetical protein DSY55_01760 [Clostridia bacterium]